MRLTASVAALVLLAGCGGGSDAAKPPPPASTPQAARPGLCEALRPKRLGRVRGGNVSELSGLTRTSDGRLFAIEDSGNSATVIAMRGDGRVLRRIAVPGARNVDWEDIAARGDELFIADIGDNATTRQSLQIYRLDKPPLTLRYPDIPHDAEALIVDPLRDQLLVITKGILDARAYYGRIRSGTLRRGPRLGFGLVTAAATSGSTVALRSYDTLAVWARRGREPLLRTLSRDPCVSPTSLGGEGQGEALALDARGRAAFTAPEGPDPVLRRYAPRQP